MAEVRELIRPETGVISEEPEFAAETESAAEEASTTEEAVEGERVES